MASLRVAAVEPRQEPRPRSAPSAAPKPEQAAPQARAIHGVVQAPEGEPIAGVTVVAGLFETGRPNHVVLKTDHEGRFSWQPPAGMFLVHLYAYKEGWAVSATMLWTGDERSFRETTLHLAKPGPHKAILVDEQGKPLAGAAVRLEDVRYAYENKAAGGRITGAGYSYYRREVLAGSPLEQLFITKTDDRGAFALGCLSPEAWLRLAVTTADGRHLRVKLGPGAADQNDTMMEGMGFVRTPAGSAARLIAFPAARVQGRVTTKLAGVSVSGLKVRLPVKPTPRGWTDLSIELRHDGRHRCRWAVCLRRPQRGDDQRHDRRARRGRSLDLPCRAGRRAQIGLVERPS